MRVKCCGYNYEPTEADACLQCALDGNNECGYDYGLLKFMYDQQSEERANEIHVTDLTGCLLRSFWSKTKSPVEFPHQMLMRSLGSITHGLLEDDSEGVWSEIAIDQEGIKGRVDRMYTLSEEGEPMKVRVVDYKTTRWLKPSNLPYGSHDLQVNIYAYLLKKDGYDVESAWIQYIDLSGPTKCRTCKLPVVPVPDGLACPNCGHFPRGAHLGAVMFEVDLMDEDEIGHFVGQRRDALALSMEMEQAPDAEPSFLCSYCSFLEECDQGLMHLGR